MAKICFRQKDYLGLIHYTLALVNPLPLASSSWLHHWHDTTTTSARYQPVLEGESQSEIFLRLASPSSLRWSHPTLNTLCHNCTGLPNSHHTVNAQYHDEGCQSNRCSHRQHGRGGRGEQDIDRWCFYTFVFSSSRYCLWDYSWGEKVDQLIILLILSIEKIFEVPVLLVLQHSLFLAHSSPSFWISLATFLLFPCVVDNDNPSNQRHHRILILLSPTSTTSHTLLNTTIRPMRTALLLTTKDTTQTDPLSTTTGKEEARPTPINTITT